MNSSQLGKKLSVAFTQRVGFSFVRLNLCDKEGGLIHSYGTSDDVHLQKCFLTADFRCRLPRKPSKVRYLWTIRLIIGRNLGGKYVATKPMDKQDMEETLEEWAHAANMAIRAGFDGVEIHGANGYLLEYFFLEKFEAN